MRAVPAARISSRAKIYKISGTTRGKAGTHMKITGGSLKVQITPEQRAGGKGWTSGAYDGASGGEHEEVKEEKARSQEENARPNARMRNRESWEEKADQIRIYSGAGYSRGE